MKKVFEDNGRYSNDAALYLQEAENHILPLIDKGFEKGFSLEQIQAILFDSVADMLLTYRVASLTKDCKNKKINIV